MRRCIQRFGERAAKRQGKEEEMTALDKKANFPYREADNGAILCCTFVPLCQTAWTAANTLTINPAPRISSHLVKDWQAGLGWITTAKSVLDGQRQICMVDPKARQLNCISRLACYDP